MSISRKNIGILTNELQRYKQLSWINEINK